VEGAGVVGVVEVLDVLDVVDEALGGASRCWKARVSFSKLGLALDSVTMSATTRPATTIRARPSTSRRRVRLRPVDA